MGDYIISILILWSLVGLALRFWFEDFDTLEQIRIDYSLAQFIIICIGFGPFYWIVWRLALIVWRKLVILWELLGEIG